MPYITELFQPTSHTSIFSGAQMNTDFEQWAASRGYDIAPAVLPAENRLYADRQTQAAFDAWNAGAAFASRDIMRSMVDGVSPEELAAAGIV
jgi:hypothetical protein